MEFKPGHYLAFKLSDSSRHTLLLSFHAKFSKVYAHHVTIEFNLTEEKLKKMLGELGTSKVKVYVTGFSRMDDIECATIKFNGHTKRPDGGTYHLTYSLNPPKKPVDSNSLLLASAGEPMYPLAREIMLDGEVILIKK